MSLKEYNRKRDFKITSEPSGKLGKAKTHRFVIQKHAASHLHYDFRLEMNGTLKSWAVPKGVPYAKGEKRLAMEVEDHPVDYINFEGTIPKGQYGGGTVMVWDRGTYEALSDNPAKELAGGKLHFVLNGKKLSGEWYLVRLREGNQWLLIKGGSDYPRTSAKLEDTSAISGKSMEQLSRSKKVWQSNREIAEAGADKTSSGKNSAKSKTTPRKLGQIRQGMKNFMTEKVVQPRTKKPNLLLTEKRLASPIRQGLLSQNGFHQGSDDRILY